MAPRNHNVPMSYYQNEEDDDRDLYHTLESSNRRESPRRQDAFRTSDSYRMPDHSNPRYPSRMPVFSREPELERRSDHFHTAETYYEPREQRRQESWANEQGDGNRSGRQESYYDHTGHSAPKVPRKPKAKNANAAARPSSKDPSYQGRK
jgi:hypothetical protein